MTDWKPEKNISSPWDVDVWENNIGQPVKPSGDNLPYPYTPSYIYNGEWYNVDTTKITTIKDVELLFSALGMKVGTENENFDKVKHLLIIPEKPKTLEQISQELDEKIDALIKTTKEKFECSNYFAGKRYNEKFDRIIQDFEYAKEHGSFPQKLTLGYSKFDSSNFVVSGSSVESSFVIKQGKKHDGYYTNGNRRYLRYYMPDKPNMIVRFFMRTCLGFYWVDEKDT